LETVIWKAAVNRKQFEEICTRLINNYFTHPSYYTIKGCPVFQIYDLNCLITGLGGLDETKAAFEWFRAEACKAGLPGLHLQYTGRRRGFNNLSGVDSEAAISSSDIVSKLGFDSMTHYQFVHFTNIDREYSDIMIDIAEEWKRIDSEYSIPYFPHVSVGWDNNPRFQNFRPGVVKNNTPEEVEKAFIKAKHYVDSHPDQPPLVTINSWNEWTETSYLQPDDLYGYGYLEAIKRTFVTD
jgi:hypothetical protein